MKRIFLCILIIISASGVSAQETLIRGNIESGGFGGPVLKGTELNGETALMVGGKGGWIINHKFILGGGGYGLVTGIKEPETGSEIALGYGGVLLGYVPRPRKMIHSVYNVLIGAGGIDYKKEDFDLNDTGDSFFVIEAGAEFMLNVTKDFRVGVGASYRYFYGVNFSGFTDENLSGVSANLVFKFGAF